MQVRRHHDGTWYGSGTPGTGWDASGLWSYSEPTPVYQVVIEYLDEEAGRYAARAAVRCQNLVDTGHYLKQDLEQDLQDLKDLMTLGPTQKRLSKLKPKVCPGSPSALAL